MEFLSRNSANLGDRVFRCNTLQNPLAFYNGKAFNAIDIASVSGATIWNGTTDMSSEMISGTPSISSNKVYVTVYGGTDGVTYNLRLRVVTTNGDQIEDDLDVVVIQKGQ